MKGRISASELVAYTRCSHSAALAAEGVEAAGSSEDVVLLQKKGGEHEKTILSSLEGCFTVERRNAEATLAAMRAGHPWIYHGWLADGDLVGEPDFLRRVERPSRLGAYSYEPYDAKLGRALKPEYVLQLCHYGGLLERAQGALPESAGVYCGGKGEFTVKLGDYLAYYRNLLQSYRDFLSAAPETEAYPVEYCGFCGYRGRCEGEWLENDHLSQVLDIRRTQVSALSKMGIRTRAQLAVADQQNFKREKGLTLEGYQRLVAQAKAQVDETLGYRDRNALKAIPEPGTGDLFFDMESDPHVGETGLEYLFGFWVREGKTTRFEKFWAHSPEAEKVAVEQTVDFMRAFRVKHPGMHIYHYNNYEPNHMVDLTSRHGTREEELDDLLRNQVFVDLYPIVRRGFVLPTSSRSLKALEPLMGFERSGDLKAAAGSIVFYERWLETGEQKWLDDIEVYNREDVEATACLYDWLRGLK